MKRFQAQYQYLVLDRSILPICWSLTVDGNWWGVKQKGASAAYVDSLSIFNQTELLLDKNQVCILKSRKGKVIEIEVI